MTHATLVTIPQAEQETLLKITTQGRYSGEPQASLLPYRIFDNQYLVGASNTRRQLKPDWYLNLKEEPIVQVQIADASFYAKATTPIGSQRVKVLSLLRNMLQFQDKIPRETSAVLLTPLC